MQMKRRAIVQASGAVVLVLVTGGVTRAAVSHSGAGQVSKRVDHQTAIWRTERLTFAEQRWTSIDWARKGNLTVRGGTVLVVNAEGTITVTVSAEVKGGPFALRVLDGTHVMRPGPVHGASSPHQDVFSFSFARDGGHPLCGRKLSVQVRPATDAPTVVHRVDMIALFKTNTHHERQTGCV